MRAKQTQQFRHPPLPPPPLSTLYEHHRAATFQSHYHNGERGGKAEPFIQSHRKNPTRSLRLYVGGGGQTGDSSQNHCIDWRMLTTTALNGPIWSTFSELFVAPREPLAGQKLFLFRHRGAFIFHEQAEDSRHTTFSTQHIHVQEL